MPSARKKLKQITCNLCIKRGKITVYPAIKWYVNEFSEYQSTYKCSKILFSRQQSQDISTKGRREVARDSLYLI